MAKTVVSVSTWQELLRNMEGVLAEINLLEREAPFPEVIASMQECRIALLHKMSDVRLQYLLDSE